MKDTKERIVREALKYFGKNDYERASLNDIAGALGITKGAIYHYFGSKDELFKETVLTALRDLGNIFAGMDDAGGEMPVGEAVRLWFNFGAMIQEANDVIGLDMLRDYANVIYLMFTAMKKFPDVKDLIHNIYTSSLEGLTLMLERAKGKGEINRSIDTAALAFEMTAFAEGAMLMAGVMKGVDLVDLGNRCYENFRLRLEPGEEDT